MEVDVDDNIDDNDDDADADLDDTVVLTKFIIIINIIENLNK
jgi:hypothetical protein